MREKCERQARSLALEKAYVHQVYQQISDVGEAASELGRPWPKVVQFLQDLEPGSLVCDVGCGSGKYLDVNPAVFTVGADRCKRLAEVVREKDCEVMMCDNLSLPYRDESFDAVLSIAVIHHFATTERRVAAIRELTRILKIGGRVVITVWAMEQRHRRVLVLSNQKSAENVKYHPHLQFESQDVLVPWHRPQNLSTPSLDASTTATNTSDEDGPTNNAASLLFSDGDSIQSQIGNQVKRKTKSRYKDLNEPNHQQHMNSSQSSSSLSSPNETCYSFVRRALQKLARGKKGTSSGRHRPWFLHSWSTCTQDASRRRYDPDGCENIHLEDIQNVPIELRRLEEDVDDADASQNQGAVVVNGCYGDNMGQKSKSMTDMPFEDDGYLQRSRSSVPSLDVKSEESTQHSGGYIRTIPLTSSKVITTQPKPRLMKQKQSLCDEDIEDEKDDQLSEMQVLIKSLPQFKGNIVKDKRRNEGVLKQNSMHEEIMSLERLQENERVRKNLLKQFSLNEEYDFRRQRPLDSLRETILSTSAAKRIQLLKIGLTNKIKTTKTAGIEKVSSASLKNGFAKIFQGWKHETPPPSPRSSQTTPLATLHCNSEEASANGCHYNESERRHSKEDSSDSSKDSSLQSDTSVDSEDSFASVIFIPKPDQMSPPISTSPTQTTKVPSPQANFQQPLSPKFKFQSPTSPMIVKQPSLPSRYPTTPQPMTPRPMKQQSLPISPKFKFQVSPLSPGVLKTVRNEQQFDFEEKGPELSPVNKGVSEGVVQHSPPPPPPPPKETVTPALDAAKIERILTSSKQLAWGIPIVRRTLSNADDGRAESLVQPMPQLLSLDLFNPETDDIDSDSSAASTPDSVSSVISIQTEELSTSSHDAPSCKPSAASSDLNLSDQSIASLPNSKSPELNANARSPVVVSTPEGTDPNLLDVSSLQKCVRSPENVSSSTDSSPRGLDVPKEECAKQKPVVPVRSSSRSPEILRRNAQMQKQRDERFVAASVEVEETVRSAALFNAVADVANSLEGAVDAVIQSSPRCRRKKLEKRVLSPEKDEFKMKEEVLPLLYGFDETSESDSENVVRHGSSWSLGRERWQKRERKQQNQSSWSLSRLDKREKHQQVKNEPPLSIRQRRNIRSQSLSLYNPDYLHIESEKQEEAESEENISTSLPSGLDDPYTTRISVELNDLTRLTTELKKRNNYLASLSDKDLNKELNQPYGNPFLTNQTLSTSSNPFSSQLTSNPFLDELFSSRELPSGCSSQTEDNFVPLEIDSPPQKRIENLDGAESLVDIEDPTISRRKPSIIMTNSSPGPTENTAIDLNDLRTSRKNSLPGSRDHSLESTETDLSEVSRKAINIPRDMSRVTLASSMGHSQESNDNSSHPSDLSHMTLDPSLESNFGSDGSRKEFPRDMSKVTIASSLGQSMEESEVPEYPRRDVYRFIPNAASMGHSLESSDLGEVSERTGSGSDYSKKETFSGETGPTGGSSTSLAMSGSDCSKDTRYADRRKTRCDGRSSSEETPRKVLLVRQKAALHEPADVLAKASSVDTSLNASTSQESLPSDGVGGGSITFHRFYHVFREGELDQLIERYVDNLHIISSYYDHANWCIVAEKVHVWTI